MRALALPAIPAFPPAVRRWVEGGGLAALVGVAGAGLALGWGGEAVRVALAVVFLGSVAWTDARYGLIPNRLAAGAGLLGLALHALEGAALPALLAGAIAASAFGLVRAAGHIWKGRPGMGWGDVKLALALGLLLGWTGLWALYLGVVVAAVAGGVHRARTGAEALPLAPWIAVGAALALTVLPFERIWAWVA